MRLHDLQSRLREQIRARMDRGELTGTALSRAAGFQQAHLSNFLNERRGLSLESMDRLLDSLELEVLDLVDPGALRPPVPPPNPQGLQSVVVVAPELAARSPRFSAEQVAGATFIKTAFLRRLRPNDVCQRDDWLRFVALKLDRRSAGSLQPQPVAGATLLVDRHYTSLEPWRRSQLNLYAARVASRLVVGQVWLAGGHLVVQPRNPLRKLELVRIDNPRDYADCIIGRVCHVAIEV